MLTESIIPNPTDIVKCCYEAQIQNQHLTQYILQDYLIEESKESDDNKKEEDKGFFAWIKKQFQKVANTIRKWISAIGKFFTKTLPEAIGKFVDKVLRFLKIRKTKNVKMPKNVTEEDKRNIKKATDMVNKEVQKEIAKATLAPNANIESKEKEVKDAISKVENGEASNELMEAFKSRYILVFGDGDSVMPTYKTMCKKLSGPLDKSLSAIADFCNKGKQSMDFFIKKLSDELSDTTVMDNINNTDAAEQFRNEIAPAFKMDYAHKKASLVKNGKMYSREQMDKIPREKIDVEQLKKELTTLRNNKNASIIYNTAKAQSDGLLKLIDLFLNYFKTDLDKNQAKKYTNIYMQYQKHVMKIITDATDDYTSYLNYAINEYKEAIAGTFNMNIGKLDYEDPWEVKKEA